jgi:hypothetical protein
LSLLKGEVVGFGEKGMVNAAVRMRALSLYRALMRSVRTWPGPPNEKQYIYVSCMLSLSLSLSLSLCGEEPLLSSPLLPYALLPLSFFSFLICDVLATSRSEKEIGS